MSNPVNRQWLLAERPQGMVQESCFRLSEGPAPEPGPGEVLLRNLYLSLDPTNRGWMTDRPSYMPPVGLGEVMRGYGIAEVQQSNNPAFAAGDVVSGMIGWQDYAVSNGGGALALSKVPAGVPLPTLLNVFNATGMSAYFGLLDLGAPKPGETVVVSGAAGAVGSLAGQIAKIKGCRVIGIAGSDDKCAWVVNDLGFDACINYKTENVDQRLGELCPDGIDIYFDNVGGEILEAALNHLHLRARIVICGMISRYNDATPQPGPANLSNLIIQRARMEGFLVLDYAARFPEAAQELAGWMQQGRLQSREQVLDGLENAPKGLTMLFTGGNTGKLVVRIAAEAAVGSGQ